MLMWSQGKGYLSYKFIAICLTALLSPSAPSTSIEVFERNDHHSSSTIISITIGAILLLWPLNNKPRIFSSSCTLYVPFLFFFYFFLSFIIFHRSDPAEQLKWWRAKSLVSLVNVFFLCDGTCLSCSVETSVTLFICVWRVKKRVALWHMEIMWLRQKLPMATQW
jgi:hypothetical protein